METHNSLNNSKRNPLEHSGTNRLLTESRMYDKSEKMYDANDLFRKIGSSRRPIKNNTQQNLKSHGLISSRSSDRIGKKSSDYSNHHLCYSHFGKKANYEDSSNPNFSSQIRLNLREIKREIGQEKNYEKNLNKQIENVKKDYFNQLITKAAENKSEAKFKKKKIFQSDFMKKHYPQLTEENEVVSEKKFEENLEPIKSHEIIINPVYERWEESRKQFLKYKIPLILESLNKNIGENDHKEIQFVKNKYKSFFELS